jgi:hypothetical protein
MVHIPTVVCCPLAAHFCLDRLLVKKYANSTFQPETPLLGQLDGDSPTHSRAAPGQDDWIIELQDTAAAHPPAAKHRLRQRVLIFWIVLAK